jgi:hypothetical protein
VLTAALLGASLALPAAARAQTSLRWQLKAGEKFYVEEVVRAEQHVTVMDMKLNQKTTTRRVSLFTVKAADQKGFQLEQKILAWTAKQEAGSAPPDDGKLDKLARGAVFLVHLAPNGTLTSFQGYEDFLKKVGEQDTSEAKLFRMILTEEAIRSPLEMVFSVLPDKAVNPGDQWQHQLKVPTGPMGTFLFNVDYTFRNKKGDLAEIAAKGKFEYQPPRKDAEGAPFKVVKADLKSPGATGTVLFDARAGRLVEFTMKTPVSGSLKLEVMMNELEMGLEGTETRTIRLLLKPPATD